MRRSKLGWFRGTIERYATLLHTATRPLSSLSYYGHALSDTQCLTVKRTEESAYSKNKATLFVMANDTLLLRDL